MPDNLMRGQVKTPDSELSGQGVVSFRGGAGPIDNGMAAAADTFAREFGQVGDKIGKWADHAAQLEGQREGAAAGLNPEFMPTRQTTIRGEAFDKAGLQVMETRMRQEITDDLAKAYDQHGADPKKLATVLGEKGKTWLGAVPEELKPDLTLFIRGQTLTHNRQAARAQIARLEAEQKAALQNDVQDQLNLLHQQSYKLGLDETADDVRGDGLIQLEKTLSRTGLNGKRLVTPQEARRIIKSASEELTHAAVYGAFDRASLPEKERMLASWRDDFANSEGLAGDLGYAGFAKVERHLEAEIRSARHEANAGVRQFQQDVKKLQDIAEKGYVPKPADIARLEGAAAGDIDMGAQVSKLRETVDFMGAARRWRPEEIDKWTKGERSRLDKLGASTEEVHRLQTVEKLAANARTELAKDPIGWAKTVGFDVPDLDMTSPQTVAATIGQRAARADEVAQYYGIKPQYLRPDEAKLLGAKMAEGGDGMITVATAVAAGAPQKSAAIMSELAKHGGPAVAFVGGLLITPGSNSTRAATDAANGIAMMKLDGFNPRVVEGKARAAFDEEIGAVMNTMPENRQALSVVANAIYEVRARNAQKHDFDADIYMQALREALGEHKVGGETFGGVAKTGSRLNPLNWGANDGAVVVPPFVKQSGFHQAIDAIKTSDLIDPMGNRPVTADGKDITDATIRRARLVTVGNGRYLMALGDSEEDPQYVGGGKGPGGAFVLDLNRLRPILSKRRPDLVLGGVN